MFTRLRFVLCTLTCGLLLTAGAVRAEHEASLNLAADTVLENTEVNVRDKDNTTLG